MAFVLKYPTSRYWIASFYGADGRLHRRSTRETNRNRALEVARIYEKAAKGAGSPQHVRQVVSELLREHSRSELPTASVRDYGKQWLEPRRAETAPATFRRYRDAVQSFLTYLGARAARGLDEITRADVTGFRDAMLKRLSPATTNGYVKLIRRLFRTARQDGFLMVDPAEAVRAVRGRGEPTRRPFTLDELRGVLEVADEEWRNIIRCGFFTALRLGDIATLQWSQVDFDRGEIRLRTAKTGRRIVIPISTALRRHLLQYAGNPRRLSGAVHPHAFAVVSEQDGRTGTLSNQFRALLVAAGLRAPEPHRSRGIGRSNRRTASELTFHSLRHTHVSLLKDAGIPDAVTMALVGHESAAMSHRYTHVGKEALSRAAETLPEL
jgi:integrase